MKQEPSIPLDELKRLYEDLGPIEEPIGERSYAGRCGSFESFLAYGPVFSLDIAQGNPVGDVPVRYPLLVDLVMRAWPQT